MILRALREVWRFGAAVVAVWVRSYREAMPKKVARGFHATVCTPDKNSASVILAKLFWVAQYDSRVEAREAAVALRRKHTLREGMVWI